MCTVKGVCVEGACVCVCGVINQSYWCSNEANIEVLKKFIALQDFKKTSLVDALR